MIPTRSVSIVAKTLRRNQYGRAWIVAAVVILVWGVTFVNTRALLGDFSALEILVVRFALAWTALWAVEPRKFVKKCRADEWLFAAMGFCGIFCYQFLENCAIYYTNASNVAIFMSFGPIVTAVLVRSLIKERELSVTLLIGSLIAIVGVTLVSLNGVVNLRLCPLGDLMAIGAMVSWGFYSILIDKVNKKGYPPRFVIRKAFGWSLLMMLPFCVWGATESGYCALDGSFSVTLDWAANVERFSSDCLHPVCASWRGILFAKRSVLFVRLLGCILRLSSALFLLRFFWMNV